MNFRKWVFLIFIVSAFFLIVFSRKTQDITGSVSKIEQAVFSVLEKYGITHSNIVFREEKEWQKRKLLGKTVNYVLKKEGVFSKKKFPDDLRETIKKVKGARVDRILSRTDSALRDEIVFDITFKREIVVSVKLKSVAIKSKKVKSQVSTVLPGKVSRIAIVLDDFGYAKKNLEALKELSVPLTLAVLPNTRYSKEVSLFAAENNLEIILHLPMEPENTSQYLEKNTITVDMESSMVHNIIASSFDSLVFAKGASNHMGSKATKDTRIMDILFSDLKKENMYFFDSLTTEESVGRSLAEKIGLPYLRRDIFIDNEADRNYINEQIRKLEEIALEKGRAIAVGHDRETTVDVLKEAVARIKEKGIRFVKLSEMLVS